MMEDWVSIPAKYLYLVHRCTESYARDLGYSYAHHSQYEDTLDENVKSEFEELKEFAALAIGNDRIKAKLDKGFEKGIEDFEDEQED